MAQWINVLRNNSFVKPMLLPVLCEKTGTVALAQLGLMAGRQADKMLLHLEILKLYTKRNIEILVVLRKVQCHYSSTIQMQFWNYTLVLAV